MPSEFSLIWDMQEHVKQIAEAGEVNSASAQCSKVEDAQKIDAAWRGHGSMECFCNMYILNCRRGKATQPLVRDDLTCKQIKKAAKEQIRQYHSESEGESGNED